MVTELQITEDGAQVALLDSTPADKHDLLGLLRAVGDNFRPNHPRALSGKTWDTIYDPDTGEQRDVTDYEVVTKLIQHRGKQVVGKLGLTYHFEIEGRSFQFHPSFQRQRHFGIQEKARCCDCGEVRWVNIDGPAWGGRCDRCRKARATSEDCPEYEVRAATAYTHYHCRCEVCRAWNASARRRQRRQNRKCDSTLIDLQTQEESSAGLVDKQRHKSISVLSHAAPATWSWLPAELREALMVYRAHGDGRVTVRALLADPNTPPRVKVALQTWARITGDSLDQKVRPAVVAAVVMEIPEAGIEAYVRRLHDGGRGKLVWCAGYFAPTTLARARKDGALRGLWRAGSEYMASIRDRLHVVAE